MFHFAKALRCGSKKEQNRFLSGQRNQPNVRNLIKGEGGQKKSGDR